MLRHENETSQNVCLNSWPLLCSQVVSEDFPDNCCYKINTGAPVPDFADCVIQVEDTKIVVTESNMEKVIEILVEPTVDLDIR